MKSKSNFICMVVSVLIDKELLIFIKCFGEGAILRHEAITEDRMRCAARRMELMLIIANFGFLVTVPFAGPRNSGSTTHIPVSP